jgi:hypothetical protein
MTAMNDINQPSELNLPDSLCAEVIALLPNYVADQLGAPQRKLVEAVLPFCPEAQSALRDYRALTDAMLRAVPSAGKPPPFEALLTRLDPADAPVAHAAPVITPVIPARHAAPRPHHAPPLPIVPAPRRNVRRPWRAAAALLVALLVGMNAYWAWRTNEVQGQQRALIEQLLARAESADATALQTGNNYRRLTATTPEMADVQAVLTWNTANRLGALYVSGMPNLAVGQTYQLWLVDETARAQSLGTFQSDGSGIGVLLFRSAEALERFAHIGVSIEPAPGSPNPTTPHVILGDL